MLVAPACRLGQKAETLSFGDLVLMTEREWFIPMDATALGLDGCNSAKAGLAGAKRLASEEGG